MPKKGPTIVLTLPDGSSVVGELLEELQGAYLLRRPLSFRQHPMIDGLVVKKYNRFTTEKNDPVVFNSGQIVATYYADKNMSKVYRKLAKAYQTDTMQFSMVGMGQPLQQPAPPAGQDLARAITGDDAVEEIDFDELRSATTRLKD